MQASKTDGCMATVGKTKNRVRKGLSDGIVGNQGCVITFSVTCVAAECRNTSDVDE